MVGQFNTEEEFIAYAEHCEQMAEVHKAKNTRLSGLRWLRLAAQKCGAAECQRSTTGVRATPALATTIE